MPRKLQTKLLKLVLKRSELMRAPFRGSSWEKKTNQIDNKSVGNKSGARFRSKVEKLSVEKTWSAIEKEWIIIKQTQSFKQKEQCLCGRPNLKFVTYLKNTKNNNEISAGNCCLLTLKR